MGDFVIEPNIHDKVDVDEELEEMEADASESDQRSGSIPDPYSLRTTPNSVISITDEETVGDTIDLTKDVDVDIEDTAITNWIERQLREDTYKVLRILRDEKGPMRTFDEIYAYLEAHIHKSNRVQIVVEEFLGMHDEEDASRTPSPNFRLPEPEDPGGNVDNIDFSGKGKGVGKNSNSFRPVKVPESDESVSTSSTGAKIVSPVAIKRSLSEPIASASSSSSQPKKIKEETNDGATSSKRRPSKENLITEDMLYGPFDFTQHRSGNKTNRRTQNLSSALHNIVEENESKRKFTLTPSRLRLSPENSVVGSPNIKTERRDYIQPPTLSFGSSNDLSSPIRAVKSSSPLDQTIPSQSATLNNSLKSPQPQAINLNIVDGIEPVGARTDRTPSIEVMREEIVVDATQEVVEIPDDPVDGAEITALADNLIAMFPETPLSYIRARCIDLAGKPAAIERFTEELLLDPNPPSNWEQIYKKPFHIIGDNNVPPPPPLVENNLNIDNGIAPPVSNDDSVHVIESGNASTSASNSKIEVVTSGSDSNPVANDDSKPISTGPSTSRLTHETSQENKTEPVYDENSSGLPSEPKPDLDPLVAWELERHSQLISMFPEVCPDYLLNMVQVKKPDKEGQGTSSAQGSAVELSIEQLDSAYAAKVEQMFAMRPEEKRQLPTRVQWEIKKKEKEELEKWSGNMSVNDMLLLYSDDPAGYFGNPDRKPESDLYKQHAVEGLKHEFRYQSVTEIEKIFKRSKFLYLPAYKKLSQGKTRKTKRPDIEIKFPTNPCIEFLKEKKYIELEEQIKAEKERRAADRETKIEAAKLLGNLQECLCCYSSDCLSEEMISCKGGHLYCTECISRGTSVAIGDGKTVIECLGHCSEEIPWQELQKVLAPNVLSKLLQRRQAEEVGAADMDNVVSCPFCPYVTIMDNPDDKVLVCRNPECGRESCRLCQEPNHVPLRCNEVEKKEEEEERKRIEEQLSEAMMRECWKCKVKYFKEEGCNKMSCPRPGCGATMCYLCKQPVKDYTHFYGQGGVPDKSRTCPLWTDNKKLHEQEVAKAAAKAKEDLKKKNIQLKHDPTAGVAMPAGGNGADGNVAPDVADVIAPGVPRELLVRQQRQIEDMIRHGGRAPHMIHPHVPMPHMQIRPVQLHGPPGNPFRDGMLEQMNEILRMREQQRANMRLIRQREQQALRDFERAARNVYAPAPPPVPAPAPLPPAPFPVYGNPQAVPEPLPFLDLVENHGRNIHVVQQQRMPFIAGPQINPPGPPMNPFQGRVAPQPPPPVAAQPPQRLIQGIPPPPPAAPAQAQQPGQPHGPPPPPPGPGGVRRVEMFHRHPYRAGERERRHREDALMRLRRKERERRSREEAVMRLRRNREEVLRRQRRRDGDMRHGGHHHHHHPHDHLEAGEVRVERVQNVIPAPVAQQAEHNPTHNRPNRDVDNFQPKIIRIVV